MMGDLSRSCFLPPELQQVVEDAYKGTTLGEMIAMEAITCLPPPFEFKAPAPPTRKSTRSRSRARSPRPHPRSQSAPLHTVDPALQGTYKWDATFAQWDASVQRERGTECSWYGCALSPHSPRPVLAKQASASAHELGRYSYVCNSKQHPWEADLPPALASAYVSGRYTSEWNNISQHLEADTAPVSAPAHKLECYTCKNNNKHTAPAPASASANESELEANQELFQDHLDYIW